MIVVAHEDMGVEYPVRFDARLEQTGLEGRFCPLGPEQVRPVVAPVDHVVARPGEFESKLAGHAAQPACSLDTVNINFRSLTLFHPPHGVHFVSGGKEELKLAEFFKERATAVEAEGFIQLAATRRSLAKDYERETERDASGSWPE